MPTIDVSEQQRAFLQALRDELQDEVKYGSVREQDALQYLIDHFEGGGDLDVDADVEVDTAVVEDGTEETSADGGSIAADAPAADGDAADAGGDGGSDAAGSDAAGSDDDASGSSSGPTPDAAGDGDDRLNAMMNLLDTHGDKWREASKEDARYEVDMPDGTTEYVQTKDDVRAHIFKNYD